LGWFSLGAVLTVDWVDGYGGVFDDDFVAFGLGHVGLVDAEFLRGSVEPGCAIGGHYELGMFRYWFGGAWAR